MSCSFLPSLSGHTLPASSKNSAAIFRTFRKQVFLRSTQKARKITPTREKLGFIKIKNCQRATKQVKRQDPLLCVHVKNAHKSFRSWATDFTGAHKTGCPRAIGRVIKGSPCREEVRYVHEEGELCPHQNDLRLKTRRCHFW